MAIWSRSTPASGRKVPSANPLATPAAATALMFCSCCVAGGVDERAGGDRLELAGSSEEGRHLATGDEIARAEGPVGEAAGDAGGGDGVDVLFVGGAGDVGERPACRLGWQREGAGEERRHLPSVTGWSAP